MNAHVIIFAGILFFAPIALAQSPSYSTPEYSGPTARFDQELETRRDQENALRASRERLQEAQRIHQNDLAVERQNTARSTRVQKELQRQRETHQRANDLYILKTNQ